MPTIKSKSTTTEIKIEQGNFNFTVIMIQSRNGEQKRSIEIKDLEPLPCERHFSTPEDLEAYETELQDYIYAINSIREMLTSEMQFK